MSEMKLIRLYVERRFLLPLRIVFLLAALPFLADVYSIITSGVADDGRTLIERRDGLVFYSFLAKKAAFGLFFVWLATGALKEKTENKPTNSG